MSLDILFASTDEKGKTDGPREWVRAISAALGRAGLKVGVAIQKPDEEKGQLESTIDGENVTCFTRVRSNHRDDSAWYESLVLENKVKVFVAQHVVAALTASYRLRKVPVETVMVVHSDDQTYWRLCRFYLQRSDPAPKHVACVSRYLYEAECEKKHADYEVHRIPCGVEVVPDPVPDLQAAGELRLLYVGRLDQRQKRILDVVRALCLACSNVEGVSATVVGSGREEKSARLLAGSLSGGEKVNFAGLRTREETKGIIRKHDVIVLLSDYEGLPISLMEAMGAALIPVVTKMRSGIPELVSHEETGMVVNEREEQFVDAIRRLREDDHLRQKIRSGARNLIRESYSIETSVEKWSALVERAGEQNKEKAWPAPPLGGRFPSGLWKEPWGDASVSPLAFKPLAAIYRAAWNCWLGIPVEKRVRIKRLLGKRDPATV